MASPDHKAGLSVVVPTNDNRSQARGKVKQNIFSSPRKPTSLPSSMNAPRQSPNATATPRYSNPSSSCQQPNRKFPMNTLNQTLPEQLTNGTNSKQLSGIGYQQPSNVAPPTMNRAVNTPLKEGVPARPRLLGVDEALKYSPFSSIIPFSSDIIPTPNAELHGAQPIFPTLSEQHTAKEPLKYLDEELDKTGGRSHIAQRVRHELKPYLNQNVITDFRFKPIKGLHGGQNHIAAKQGNSGRGRAPIPTIGPFANTMLQATDLANRYPTPISPEKTTPATISEPQTAPAAIPPNAGVSLEAPLSKPKVLIAEENNQSLHRQPPGTPATQRHAQNDAAFFHNSKLSAKSALQYTPVHPQPTPMVIIPLTPTDNHRNDFVTYEEPPVKEVSGTSAKRKRDGEINCGTNPLETKNQRAMSDGVLRQFQDLLQEIFEIEDASQTVGSGSLAPIGPQYFVTTSQGESNTLTLSTAAHIKIESLLHKLNNLGRIEDVPAEHLQRLQRLCEGSLTSADSADLHIDTQWDAEGFASWILGLEVVDAGLRSARTVLRIMTGGREEKQLYSEELLQTLLGMVKRVLDNVIVPLVEARSSGSTSSIFEGATEHKKVVSQLLFDTTKAMALLAELLTKVEMAEVIVTRIEFFATSLLFVENSHGERDSVFGIQKVEKLRRTAMDQISVIFSRYPDQRIFLLNEILTSLQKLPVNEKHARQYKLPDGKVIMLVSALIMQLVHISAKKSSPIRQKTLRKRKSMNGEDQESDLGSSNEEHQEDISEGESNMSDGSDRVNNANKIIGLQRLSKNANGLVDNATKSAQYVTTFLVQRASNTAKSSESPHRQHLDIFVQDLIKVLGLPEWPAAEILLRMIYASCRNIVEGPKSSAPAKNMALELLGMMGSAISDLVSSTRHASRSLDDGESDFSGHLRQALDDYLDGSLESRELVMLGGPYHAIMEYLERNKIDDGQSTGAQAYYLAQWAKAVSSAELKASSQSNKLVRTLAKTLLGAGDGDSDSLPNLSMNQSRVAYALTVLSMGFCRQSDYILKILLDSITSEQITVRTRSLKSVDKILEGDPSVLDRARNVKGLISNCANDASPMVRDSALTLIGKCITLRPTLEQEFLRLILRLTDDPAAGVRKRSIKMLKDIYIRNSDMNVKTAIGDNLLQRAKDLDTGVAELARQTFEDIWLSPFWTTPNLADASAQDRVNLRVQTKLIVATVRRGEKVATVLTHLLKAVLSNSAKNAAANFKVCKHLVATAFDIIIDDPQDVERLEQRHLLHTLTVFASANAKLFTPDQLQSLQPYIANLSGRDDLEVFRSIVIVFRCVLPVQSNVQHGLLREIQKALLQSISKLGKAELNEVAECLWTINGTLQNPEMLLRLTISVLKNLHNLRDTTFTEANQTDGLKRLKKYIQIAGYFGKHCNFEAHLEMIEASFPGWKGRSVVQVIIESISPFTTSDQPLSLRAEAFDSIGLVCQSWPFQFTQEHVSNAFQDVLRKGEPNLQTIVLSSFRDFFTRIDHQAEAKNGEALEGVNVSSEGKLGGSMTANEGDGASALIAQRFLKDILHIALASQTASALTATEVIASVNRQGLVHPKESGPALVALETSTNSAIAEVAFQEHRVLHQQHESMFEREYMRAIQEAFKYQKEIVGDTLGYTARPYASKLSAMFDIIKTSKGKYQKKFLSHFCSRIDFDVVKMDFSGNPPNVLQFSRFLTENLAFFDYGRLDELLHTIACMEKIVADTGSGIAHSISTEVFNITVDSMPEATVPGASQEQALADASRPSIDPWRLRRLTTASIILTSLWESRTYLRRLYGLNASQQRREGKTKGVAKDINKAPSRVQGVTGDKLVASIAEKVDSLNSEESMTQQCKDFVELLSVDSEVKVGAESEEGSEHPHTPSGDEEPDTPMSGRSQGVKRKGSVSTAGTPMKKKKGRPPLKRRKSGKSVGSDEDWD